MPRTRFRVNPHSVVARMSRDFLLETGVISEVYVTTTVFEPKTTLARKRTLSHCLAKLIKFLS